MRPAAHAIGLMAYGLHEQLQDRRINAREFIREIAAAVEEAIDDARSKTTQNTSKDFRLFGMRYHTPSRRVGSAWGHDFAVTLRRGMPLEKMIMR